MNHYRAVDMVADDTAHVAADIECRGGGRIIIGPYVTIESRVILDTGNEHGVIKIGSRTKIKTGSLIRCYGNQVNIGHRVSVGEYCMIAGHGGVSIGDLTIIGPYAMVNAASHIISGDEPFRFQGETTQGIVIGQDVWIGARATILDNVTVADRSIIGAHSLVKSSTLTRSISVGTPAKMLRRLEERVEIPIEFNHHVKEKINESAC